MEYSKIDSAKVDKLVNEIETIHCKISDEELKAQQLKPENIRFVHEFCSKPRKEKLQIIKQRIANVTSQKLNSRFIEYTGSYSCWADGINYNIPTYQDLGLSSGSCSWHDTSPQMCRIQAAVACLWGCTNIDPVLGWHTKYFSSRTTLENAVISKGYQRITDPAYGQGYRRTLPRGYSYELSGQSVNAQGTGTWHNEGPEPDPRFNWYAFSNLWWPVEVFNWHMAC